MDERKLTPEQIENLFEFCEFHNVHYYDVQIELVDHMASAIEELWETNPESPFEETVFMIGEQLGGEQGFELIKEKKEKALCKQYNRLFLKFLGTFFKLPRIILTLAFTITFYTSLRYLDHRKTILLIATIVLIIFYLAFLTIDYYTNKFRINHMDNEKSFLIVNYFYRIKSRANRSGGALYFVIIYFFKPFIASQAALLDLLGSTLIVLLFISYYALMFYMPKQVKRHFGEQFPQFVKS